MMLSTEWWPFLHCPTKNEKQKKHNKDYLRVGVDVVVIFRKRKGCNSTLIIANEGEVERLGWKVRGSGVELRAETKMKDKNPNTRRLGGRVLSI